MFVNQRTSGESCFETLPNGVGEGNYDLDRTESAKSRARAATSADFSKQRSEHQEGPQHKKL